MLFDILKMLFMVLYSLEITRKKIQFKNRKIIILGGSSGLGLALGKLLKSLGGDVTIVGRNVKKLENLKNQFKILSLDISTHFLNESCDYDFIFCCVGTSIPKYYFDHTNEEIQKLINQNYYSVINALKEFTKYNTKKFTYIMVASSLALYSLPGYSVYSSMKSALLNFFEAAMYEHKNVSLKIYLTSTIYTDAFEEENKIKPETTKKFESFSYNQFCSAENRAFDLIRSMGYRNMIASDLFTYLSMINRNCECLKDYIFLPFGVIYNAIFNFYKKNFFKKMIES